MNTRQKFVCFIGAIVFGASGVALTADPSAFYTDGLSAPISPDQYLATAQRLGMEITEEDEGYKRVVERYSNYLNDN